jgi:hypothetical protein
MKSTSLRVGSSLVSTVKVKGTKSSAMAKDAYKDTFNLHQQLLIDKITKANIPGQVNNPSTPKGQVDRSDHSKLSRSSAAWAVLPLDALRQLLVAYW